MWEPHMFLKAEPRQLKDLPRIAKSAFGGLASGVSGEDRARPFLVALHFLRERSERIELALFPDTLDEFDLHLAPVKIAAEVEEMDLQQRRTVIDGRPDAEAGHSRNGFAVRFTIDKPAYGIDPMRKPAGRLEGDIGRRNAERAAETLPGDDRAGYRIAAPETARRGFDVAALERSADRRGRHDPRRLSGAFLDLGDDVDGKAMTRAGFREKGRRSGAGLAEMKVPSDHDRADGEPFDQNFRDEFFRMHGRERGVEGQEDDAGKSERLGEAGLHVCRGQAKRDRAVGKKVGRVRF